MNPSIRRRLAWTLLAVFAVVAAWSGLVDDAGEHYAEKAFTRALVTFAVSRTLNGAISVAQGTEVAVEPAGVGVIFSVGQILDPINDLVERFSAVMLVATSSLGLQNVLLDITAWWGMDVALVAAAGFVLLALWWPRTAAGGKTEYVAIRVLLIALFLRFAIPLLVIGTNLVFDTFLAAEQTAATEALEATSTEIEEINEEAGRPPAEDQSLLDQLGSMIDNSLESMNVSARLERLREQVANASEHIINLIVIFVFQTVILPLVFIWLLVQLLKSLTARATRL
jgi:hypothetical protein